MRHRTPFIPKKGTWRHYNIFDGLAHNIVSAIYQDPSGLLWFGTHGGVSRYDGKEFVNFTTKDGLANNRVWAIHHDPDGVMWFGTDNGVSRHDRKNFTNLALGDGIRDNGVIAICRSSNGSLWFGTYNGVLRYDGVGKEDLLHFTSLTTKDGLVNDAVFAIREDANGNLWFGTWGGVSVYDGVNFVNFTTKDGLIHNTVRAIYQALDGTLWFGTNGGVSRYDGDTFVSFTDKEGLAGNIIRAIHGDPDGVLWFGTADGGISRYDGRGMGGFAANSSRGMGDFPHFVNFTTEDGLVDNNVRAILRASDGSLWIGTGIDGVSKYDEKAMVSFTERDGIGNRIVRIVYETADGNFWFGTEGGGVSCYDGEKFTNFTVRDGLASDYIWAIYQDLDGNIWFGTEEGVSRYDGKQFINITTQDGLADNYIRAIYQDTQGALWFGTRHSGVSRYDGQILENFTAQNGLVGEAVRAICQDMDGNLWFGTENGASRYDGEKFVNFTPRDGLVDSPIWSIYQDSEGILWFGTENGVSRYDGKNFATFTTQDGLINDFVTAIHRTSDGVMWFGTSGFGVSRYDGIIWTSLDTRDGLAGNTIYSIYGDSDGNLWFATDRGITRYQVDRVPPRAIITAVTADKRFIDISSLDPITVGTRVTYEYGSVDFKTHPQKRFYRCGISEEEGKASTSLTIAYGQPTRETRFDWIPEKPGRYIFQVQAIDRDGNYSQPETIQVKIQPHPHDAKLSRLEIELDNLRREVGRKYQFDNIIGSSPAIRHVFALTERAIDSGLTVLISGETGTGKELVARAIHYNGPRRDYPMLERNCGALPKELVANELFGHVRGAFTGANEDKPGLFEAATGGTVLLDEVGEMPMDAQVHLLRVLQERKVQRLGEFRLRDADVRVIAMTNRDLEADVKEGRFRADLYYRLGEFSIAVPPLRERAEDIPLLAEQFMEEAKDEMQRNIEGFASGAMEILQGYSWPGNVRELRNEVRRAFSLAEEGTQIQIHHFSSRITGEGSLIHEVMRTAGLGRYRDAVDDFERRYIKQALQSCNGNRLQAAKLLGIERKSLYEKIKRLKIEDD